MQIDAILSDYDGTLCPTGSISSKEHSIPQEIENVLWDISEVIPVCIISSKDFEFLHNKTRFANIVSCIMGIETLAFQRHIRNETISVNSKGDTKRTSGCRNLDCINDSYLMVQNNTLQYNSQILHQLAQLVRVNFDEIRIELKFTATGKKLLAGITLDWRHLDDWKMFKTTVEPQMKKLIIEKQKDLGLKQPTTYIQTYSTHPFIDIYAIACSKGMAYDRVISMLPVVDKRPLNIIYLGDSENDNPAFRKATVSLGIQSDTRLKPKLDCEFNLHISNLPIFLKNLLRNSMEFSPSLITI
jgi:hydroxymethylpyrimidine pyrophosphatase-like HAD family hydrolase